MQWNARALISKWALVKPFFVEKSCDIFCIQETHFLATDIYDFNLPNYTRYDEFGSTERRQGGVSIYVTNKFPHSQLRLQTSLQATACAVRIGRVRLSICSLYLPPTDSLEYTELEGLIDQLPAPLLLCTDANSRHMMWGSDRCDRRGLVWEHLVRMHDLSVLNNGDPTRMDDFTGLYSHIDVTLTTSYMAQHMNWSTDFDLNESDHFPIYVTYDAGVEMMQPTDIFLGWNLNKARWNDFRDKCVLRFEEELGVDNCTIMTDVIIHAATDTIPQITKHSKYSCPWWNSDCQAAIAERRRAQNRFRRNRGISTLLLEFKKAKAKARRVIRQAKKDSWQKFLAMFNHNTPMSKLWDIIRRFTRKKRYNRPLPVLTIDGVRVDDTLEVGNALGSYFSNLSSQEHYSESFNHRVQMISDTMPNFDSANQECYNEPFILTELYEAIKKCGNTSMGPDKLHYAFFRQMGDAQVVQVLSLFNYLWTEGCYPAEWSHSYIIPILKPGKPACNTDSYRPIQLTSCFGKIMERMITSRLTWFVEREGLLSTYQCGFRNARSTIDHIVRLESEVRRGFFYNKYTLAVFLDFKSAYNLVSVPSLLLKLYNLGFRGRLMTFVKNYLRGRTFQVKCGRLSNVFSQKNGVVQGGIISPILFNLMINDIFDDLPAVFSHAMYADDCALWIQGRHLPNLIADMQSALNRLVEWTNIWGFTFTPAKCTAVIFRRYMRRTELDGIPQLTITGLPLRYDDEVKFLGVLLDSRLTMTRHVEYVRARALKRLPLMKCLAGRECGADRTVLIRVYKSLIRPILEYACQVLDGSANKAISSLDCVQNMCLRVATGALRTSPIIPLQIETNIPPLYMRRWELTMRYCLRVYSVEHHPCRRLIDGTLALPRLDWEYMKRISGFPIFERLRHISDTLDFVMPQDVTYKTSVIPVWQRHQCAIQKLLTQPKHTFDSCDVMEAFQCFKDEHHGYHYIYTDGSRNNGGVGCAFVHGEMRYKTKLKPQYSIFTAEAVALLQAINYVKFNCIQKSVICVDSLSVLLALQAGGRSHPLITDSSDLLHGLKDAGQECLILWVPSHSGIYGNEVADSQAKQAASNPGLEEEYEVTLQEYVPFLRTACHAQFNQLWAAYDRPTCLKDIKHEAGQWASSTRVVRREEIVLCRLRLGHTRLTHSFILDREARPECLLCDCYLTVQHILLDCLKYADLRRQLSALCQTHDLPLTLSSLLGDSHPDLLDALFHYLRDCDLLRKL